MPDLEKIQARLDVFREHYNTVEPIIAIGGRTPDEAWNEIELPPPKPLRQRDRPHPTISVVKERFKDDPNLSVIKIKVTPDFKHVA